MRPEDKASRRDSQTSGLEPQGSERVRLDRWLWAARWYKTRSQATVAIDGGHVQVAGERAKAARPVRLGEEIRIRKGPYEFHVVVRGLSDKRGSATVARALFEETDESQAARAVVAAELKAMPAPLPGLRGRPTKRDRRQLAKLFGWDED